MSDNINNSEKEVKSGKAARRSWGRRVMRALWWVFGIGIVVLFLFFILAYNGVIGYMPPVEELRNPQDKYASIIYTADGKEMGRYFRNSGNRVYADLDEISPNVVNALIATEDARFFDHSGIDMKALTRAVVKTVLMQQKNAGGGSTITQQLAKQLYTPPSAGFLSRAVQKPIEWMIAVKLERFYSKDEILKMYLNQFDFLYNAVGIKSAAKVYFNKDAKDLDILEAATLVGMVKNPAYFNPVRRPERTKQRRNVVLEQMEKAGMISEAEMRELQSKPLELDFHRVDHKEGMAPYFREELRRYLTAHKPERSHYPSWDQQKYVDDSIQWAINPLYGWIDKNPKADGTKYDIYSDGLRIYTTIDSRMQTYAEQAVNEHMSKLQGQFFREKRNSSTAPYTSNPAELDAKTREKLIRTAIKQSERHRVGKLAGLSEEEIDAQINTPTEKMVFSYADIRTYRKVQTNLTKSGIYFHEFEESNMLAVARGLSELNRNWGYTLATCGEKIDLEPFGIVHNKCIDDDLMIKYFSADKKLMDFIGVEIIKGDLFNPEDKIIKKRNNKDKGQRAFCGCIISKDIGEYNTCPHLCEYCYANASKEIAVRNWQQHNLNPKAETILGK